MMLFSVKQPKKINHQRCAKGGALVFLFDSVIPQLEPAIGEADGESPEFFFQRMSLGIDEQARIDRQSQFQFPPRNEGFTVVSKTDRHLADVGLAGDLIEGT